MAVVGTAVHGHKTASQTASIVTVAYEEDEPFSTILY
jgi:hypothetical protein